MNLNGNWKLYYYPYGEKTVLLPSELTGVPFINATVPGNVELDLSREGILPEDLFFGENILLAEKFETYCWWYEREFLAPETLDKDEILSLDFDGVDCYAQYFLNGKKIGESANMLIPHSFDVTNDIVLGKSNTLHVFILPACILGAQFDFEPNQTAFTWHQPLTNLYTRKASHGYGWDIMPRAVSAGIWRDVTLNKKSKFDFKYVYFGLDKRNVTEDENEHTITMLFDASVRPEQVFKKFKFVISGVCKDHSFEHTCIHTGASGYINFVVKDLLLWWPRNYGEPNLYDICIKVYDGEELILSKKMRQGFRTIKLEHSDIVEDGGRFDFIVNGIKVMIVGTNWVPMDAYHSRDKERLPRALSLAKEAGCNMLRLWGGNVYEPHSLFDFCDENGILVWQDFGMGCHYYPQNQTFFDIIRKEAEWVVSAFRHHASLALWCGDNEIDSMVAGMGLDPSKNIITREILPRVIERLDPYRDYIASSPYISQKAFSLGDNRQGSSIYPEDHLWGPRDYYKSDFYVNSKAYFVSETGYHGCPSKKSIEKFISPEFIWPCDDNREWNLHSTDQDNSPHRVKLMQNQIKNLFGEVPQTLDEFALASQISQAEAKKFFIERIRAKMDYFGGVIWWNLLDGWPQMSDAVIDYYYEKKLAFDYIVRSSRDLILMVDENHRLLCANSSIKTFEGTCTVEDLSSGKVIFSGSFCAEQNKNTHIADLLLSGKGMLLIRWKLSCGKQYFNTYLYGTPYFDLEEYKGWLKKINSLMEN